MLGAKGIGELADIISAGAEEVAVQQIQIQAMRYLDNMVNGNTALVFESFITLSKTSNGRETLTKIGQFYGRIISYANQNCVNLITTMQDWITSFGGN
ncbi:MAG: hypothetical protein MJ159_05260 [Treponemataceae bacterium]|nr:hypothetical protein [Treponemataceae bacterium]